MSDQNSSTAGALTSMFRLDGKVAVVTGGGSGLGRIGCEIMAEVGAMVIAADINLDAAAETADIINSRGQKAAAMTLDVTDEASVIETFAKVAADHGGTDILFTSAGSSERAPSEELSLEAWNRILNLNLTGVFLCCREGGKQMIAKGEGSIVNVSSMWGHVGGPYNGNASYHATKGAIVNLTRALAVEWGPKGVRVNDIAPTFIDTPLTTPIFTDNSFMTEAKDFIPLRRLGTPQDIAGAILYLASPASGLVTGISVKVDGGWTAR